MEDPGTLDVEQLLAERRQTLEAFRDPHRSPYAAVDRRDFSGSHPLVLGSSDDCDVRLEGLRPRHAQIRVDGDSFLVEAIDPGAMVEVTPAGVTRRARVPPGSRVELGRYTVRLSHQNFPALVLLDEHSPRLASGPPPRWFDPDPAFRVLARLDRDPSPREEIVVSTRGNVRRAQRVGWLDFEVAGTRARLVALRLLEPGVDESAVSIFFRDATTGRETYPVGRYLDPKPVAGSPDLFVLDFNRAYNPVCAFSSHYNCPVPPQENRLAVAIRAGEMDPGGHSG
ncbi:MAG: DUF1684 domain-containing protein [Myxococcales bacterium]